MPETDKLHPIYVFLSAFGTSSFAGLAALLREGKTVTGLGLLSAFLNSGILGLVLCMIWYNYFLDNIYFLVGMCGLAGLGGMSFINFVIDAVKTGGLSIGGVRIGFHTAKGKEDDDAGSQTK